AHFGRRQSRIEPDADGADLHAGAERLGELDAVGGEHHDAVAWCYVQPPHRVSERVGAGVIGAPGEPSRLIDEGVLRCPGGAVAPDQVAECQHRRGAVSLAGAITEAANSASMASSTSWGDR